MCDTPATESINYQAQAGVAHIANAENVTVNVVTTDSRVEKVIGRKKNGYGMSTAGISADEPVEVTVDRAIEQELQSRGFKIEKNSNVKITADVTKFYNEFDVTFWAAKANGEVNFSVNVKTANGQTLYNKNVKGANSFNTAFMTGVQANESVSKALADAITNLFNDKDFIAALTSAAPN